MNLKLFVSWVPDSCRSCVDSCACLDNHSPFRTLEGGILQGSNVDILDGTPLLDIKPYVPEFDAYEEVRTGWLEKKSKTVKGRKSDDRFE